LVSSSIAADRNTPINIRDAVSKGLATEVLNVMINSNLVQETVVKNSDLASVGSAKVNSSNMKNSRVFIRMNTESEAANRLVELMQDSNDLLGQLTNPQRERAGAYFGLHQKIRVLKLRMVVVRIFLRRCLLHVIKRVTNLITSIWVYMT
jgi:hypothetical protein